tara:strand:- start:7179 stop:7523 length:345 start_codon:yes stop_codon:yes gene_type:complete
MPRPKQDYVRYMCQFTPSQYSKLKKASSDGTPIAYHVRNAIDNYLDEFDFDEKYIYKKNLVNQSIQDNQISSEPKNDFDKYNLVTSLEKIINLKNRGEINEEEYKIFKSKLLEI